MDFDDGTDLADVDWDAFRTALAADGFHSGRSARHLQASFENSAVAIVARRGGAVLGAARALSDGVVNAYIVDLWTAASHRGKSVARRVIEEIIVRCPGQHIYLQADEAIGFFEKLGFRRQPHGLSLVAEPYLGGASEG